MNIEDSIKKLLAEKGKAHIEGLGTFRSEQNSAEMQEDGGVIAPPTEKVVFTEDEDSEFTIKDYMIADGVSSEELGPLLDDFSRRVHHNVELEGKFHVGNLGYFQQDSSGQLAFVTNQEAPAGADSFGLPKIKAKPLIPVRVKDNGAKPDGGSNLLLKAILIPLVVIAIALIFLFTNDKAYNALTSYFNIEQNDDRSDVADELDRTKRLIENHGGESEDIVDPLENSGAEDPTTNVDTEEKPEEDKTDEEPVKEPEDTKSEPEPASDDKIVTGKTNRYYIIIGSFSNEAAAQKAITKSNKIGYPAAKILKMDGRIRVSVEDFANKSDAVDKAGKVGKDFPGAWVLAN